MSLEQKINQKLNSHPNLKKGIKKIYQHIMYLLSSKIKCEGEVIRLSPEDPGHEYFFGYYDKSPWDASGRYVLCMKADNTWTEVAPKSEAEIILIDLIDNSCKTIALTHSWNVQQGCMAQWLGPNFDKEIIYNDFRDGKLCSVILDVFSGTEKVLPLPVYSVSMDGMIALTLDFARLHRLRPGYGYSNIADATEGVKIPDTPCIWRMNIGSGVFEPILTYKDLAEFEVKTNMKNVEHKINHIMISPDGKRFMVLHRWFNGNQKYSRLLTVNVDGTDIYNLSDDDMVSHCYWKDNETIIAFENKKESGAGYYLMKDKTQEYRHLWPHITNDGHPSYSPNGRLVVTDTYPDRKRMSSLKILNENFNIVVAKVFSPFKYDNDTRCDLHPRWSRDGKSVCFDSVHEGHRGLYMISANKINFAYTETIGTKIKFPENKMKRIKIVYLMTACKNTGPSRQTLNIIKNLDTNVFEPILITLYDEESDSLLRDFFPYVSEHYLVKTGKKQILLNHIPELFDRLKKIEPDIIHSVGVFPDYAVCQLGEYKQIHTLRNYIYDDYITKFGKVRGHILAAMQLQAIKKSDKTVVCSESLSRVYHKKLKFDIQYIRNGVDLEKYTLPDKNEKYTIRRELGFSDDMFIFVYTGQFIERKNIPFLLENYVKAFGQDKKCVMLMFGDGPLLGQLKKQYENKTCIDFRGSVPNVNRYLKACDVYVSASKSEGLPNGVLEAMASGLPVVLSDIEQHKEIYNCGENIGYTYKQGDGSDLAEKLKKIYNDNVLQAGLSAYETVHKNFSDSYMSSQYQKLYIQICADKSEKV